jgi:succinate dehydrogenase hydrophobic anchor subunit
MLLATLLGLCLALLAVGLLRLSPSARAVSPDRWLRELTTVATAFAVGAAVAALLTAIFGSGMLAADRSQPGATLPTNALMFGLVMLSVTASALYGVRHLAMRYKRLRRLLRGRGRGDPRPW